MEEQFVSHYEVLERLGGGGMGEVYRAKDILLDRIVALKFLPADVSRDAEANLRFLQEARAASALDHPNICPVYEVGETDDGRWFIAMAFISGGTLDDLLAERRPAVEEAIVVCRSVADALAAAHAAGVIHRDVKPANIMVGENGSPRVVDFGVAKLERGKDSLTNPGHVPGTAAFMSPEQVRGEDVDARTDIWSLGTVLYELLTGKRPFEGDYESAVGYAIANEDPIPPRRLNPAVSEALEAVVLRCLQKRPADRYQSAAELRTELAGLLSNDRETRTTPERRKRAALSVLILLAGIAVLAVFVVPTLRHAVIPGSKPDPQLRGLAVLPFLEVDSSSDNRALVDGMVHALSSRIDGIARFEEHLWVVPSTEVYRLGVETAVDAWEKLRVHLAITGSAHVDGDRIRMSMYLVDTRTGRSIRSRTFDQTTNDVSALEDGVVEAIEGLLAVEVDPAARARLAAGGTVNSEAYRYYVQAQGHLQRRSGVDDLELAVSFLERAVDADPGYALAISGLAQACWRMYLAARVDSWAERAEDHALEALELNDRIASSHVAYGNILNGTGRASDAERRFREALAIDSLDVGAMSGLAHALEEQDRVIEAEATYQRALRIRPMDWLLHNNLGLLYHSESRHEEAAGHFRSVVAMAPTYAYGYINLAVQLRRLDQPDRALSLYQLATVVDMDNDPARALAFHNLGVMEYARGDYQAAVDHYEHSLELDSTRLSGWTNLGNTYHWIGLRSHAEAAWQASLRLAQNRLETNPNELGALEVMALSNAKLYRVDDADAFVDRIERLPRLLSGGLITIAKVHEILGRRQLALEYIDRALRQGHSEVDIISSRWLEGLRRDTSYVEMVQRIREDQDTSQLPGTTP